MKDNTAICLVLSQHARVASFEMLASRAKHLDIIYVRATRGDIEDPHFRSNWVGAAKAGKARGAILDLLVSGRVVAQAEFFLRVVKHAPGDLVPAVRVSDTELRSVVADGEGVENLLRALEHLTETLGRKPLLLLSEMASHAFCLAKWEESGLLDYPFWSHSPLCPEDMEQVSKGPGRSRARGSDSWAMWTYSVSEGGYVYDLDRPAAVARFNGSFSDALRLLRIEKDFQMPQLSEEEIDGAIVYNQGRLISPNLVGRLWDFLMQDPWDVRGGIQRLATWQVSQGLLPTGKLDPHTLSALKRFLRFP